MPPRPFDPVAPLVAVAFASAFVAALLLTPGVRRLARRRGWVDAPDGVRKRHPSPIPRVGGLAVYAAFALGAGAALAMLPAGAPGQAPFTRAIGRLLLAATPVMLIGLLDDIRGVRPAAKIAVQAACGVYLFLAGYRIAIVADPFGGPPLALGWPLSLPLTVLWFVAISNAFNLIDGLDGLSAGVGLFATATFLVGALSHQRWWTVTVLCALAGALLGFLRYNFPPATVFLGDSGALFLGFVVAGLAIGSSMSATAAVTVIAPLWALALPILDVLLALARRIGSGQHPFTPDEDHIHHRLVRSGLSPARAVLALYGVAAAGACVSMAALGGGAVVVASSAGMALALLAAGLRGRGQGGLREAGRLMLGRYGRAALPRGAGEGVRDTPEAAA